MTDERFDPVEFDELVAVALARVATSGETDGPRPEVRDRLLASIAGTEPPAPAGFTFRYAIDDDWQPHPVPGIRMKVLSTKPDLGYVTLLLDVAPGTRFPAHHHSGAEECYVISGGVRTCERRLGPGDFLHADGGTDHGELWTEEGCRVLLVVSSQDHVQ